MLLMATILIFQFIPVVAQNSSDDIIAGKKIKIFSKILNEERPILISLPNGYDQSKSRYPVMYITDGSEFRLIASGGLIHYLSYWEVPQMITIYIPNTNRDRDLSIDLKIKENGEIVNGPGCDNFLKFLTTELIAYIDSNYRTTDYRMLLGASLGGSFVFNSLLSVPEYFDAYIAVSPHVDPDEEIGLIEKTKVFFQNHKTLNKFLFVPYYEKDYKTTSLSYPKIDKMIREYFPKEFKYQVKTYPGQAHVPKTALLDGLMALFQNWEHIKVPEIIPNAGFIHEGTPLKVELKGYDTGIRYTTDGSEPTRESILYTGPILLTRPTIIKAKTFRTNLGESEVSTAEYKELQELVVEKRIKKMISGLKSQYIEKIVYPTPDSINLEQSKNEIVKTFNINSKTRNEGFIFQFDGYINITKEGQYSFYILSSISSKLFLGKQKLIDYSFAKSGGDPRYTKEEYCYSLYLKPGYYPVRCIYSNRYHHGDEFKISYEGPGIEKQEIPAEVLFHKEN
jgi:hypothetical protein